MDAMQITGGRPVRSVFAGPAHPQDAMQRPTTWPIMIGRKPVPLDFATAPIEACVATMATSGSEVKRSAACQPARSARIVRGKMVAVRRRKRPLERLGQRELVCGGRRGAVSRMLGLQRHAAVTVDPSAGMGSFACSACAARRIA